VLFARLIAAALVLGLAACGGGDDAEASSSSEPFEWWKNCRWEYSLPGVPSSGGHAYRCYLTGEGGCRSSEICEPWIPNCPYEKSECYRCPTDVPLSQC